MAKTSLLYSDMDDYGDSSAASEFITKLLDAVTAMHKVHFMTTGPGSFAAHEALGDAYSDLEDGADALAESWMGCQKQGLTFSGVDSSSWSSEARKIYEYIESNRGVLGTESHIQNLVDEILDKLSRSLFKLDRLA